MKKIMMVFVIIMMVACVTPAFAAEGDYMDDMAKGLKGGFTDILTGWTEIPKSIMDSHNETEGTAGLKELEGLVMGSVKAVGVTGEGIFEVIASFIPKFEK